MSIEQFTASYLGDLEKLFRSVTFESLEGIASLLESSIRERRNIFLAGNGGSAAIVSHFANDLNKLASVGGFRARAISLTDNVPLLTAWANDTEYAQVFARQLENLADAEDVLLIVSSSGNSPNIVAALQCAQSMGVHTAALTGFTGGEAMVLADAAIHMPADHYGLVEDSHQILCHVLANYLRDRLGVASVEP